MGKLYVVGTPIGNLEDLTRRSVRVLGQVSLIAAEDTRVTRKLLNHLNLHVPLTSCHQHNWQAKLPSILKMLESGDVALVTDAGMPAISDPGSELVAAVAAEGFVVEVVPGVSAVTTALAASGLSGDRFLFLGFLPRRNKERRALLASTIPLAHNLVIFESPHRVGATLQNLLVALGDRDLAVCRELTKLHEEVFRGSISRAIEHFESPRGEFVLVLQGASEADLSRAAEAPNLASIENELARLRESGAKAKEAVASVAESSGLPRKEVYKIWLQTAQR
jgi:16S rRNA (cytidine1402-2'-O)-methyltransferase